MRLRSAFVRARESSPTEMSRGRSFALLALLVVGVPAVRAGSDALVGVYYATWFNPSTNPAAWSDVWGTPMLGKYESSAFRSANPRAGFCIQYANLAPRGLLYWCSTGRVKAICWR